MSFMFKPLAYDDYNAVNKISVDKSVSNKVIFGDKLVVKNIVDIINENNEKIVLLDGYIGADFSKFVLAFEKEIEKTKKRFEIINISDYYKSEIELDEMVKPNLPENYDEDPVLLFGKLFQGTYIDIFDKNKVEKLLEKIASSEAQLLIYGHGSAMPTLREIANRIIFIDVTPKITAIRALKGQFKNIGCSKELPFNLLMRRNYYVDFELAVHLRKELLNEDKIDNYIIDSDVKEFGLLDKDTFNLVLNKLVKSPFRAKPVYLEGIWGGEYIRRMRNIPRDISNNIAWIFEFIPMEVSIALDINDKYVDIPFATFLHKQGSKILGEKALMKYKGYFPIRFNYDDTWHSDGNMSIQVHPNGNFVKENYNELGSQDEAYYIVATGHGARTYVGFKKDGKEFLELCKKSEKDGIELNYREYVDSIESAPGQQIMIPAGTIHSSGQNQFILELGSLTIGSYTYKVYDYNRRDAEGKLRPIHTKNAEKILEWNRDMNWVKENIAIKPYVLNEGDSYRELQVGKTDLMYYETRRIEFKTHGKYVGSNNDQFTVLTVVDGEKVKIYSKENPEFYYEANYLDIVTVPANIKEYVIEALGYQPVVVHKTLLKED